MAVRGWGTPSSKLMLYISEESLGLVCGGRGTPGEELLESG